MELHMANDLWPDFDSDEVARSPKTVIQEAGDGVEAKTQGQISFSISVDIRDEGMVNLRCHLYSRKLRYAYPFLDATYRLSDGYPVEILADKAARVVEVASEEELISALSKIFKSQATITTIQQLIAL